MGLDIWFYAVKRDELAYYRKVNFYLTYFDIEDEDNGRDVEITKTKLEEFAADLRCELEREDAQIPNDADDYSQTLEPLNPKLRTKEVPFGGSAKYDYGYWEDLKDAFDWATETLDYFDWENYRLAIHCWW